MTEAPKDAEIYMELVRGDPSYDILVYGGGDDEIIRRSLFWLVKDCIDAHTVTGDKRSALDERDALALLVLRSDLLRCVEMLERELAIDGYGLKVERAKK